jgi:hypothetical protein
MRQFRSDSLVSTPEQIQLKLALLNSEREQLRENAGTTESLERNRLAIGRCQYELSHALIRRYLAWPMKQAA